MAYRNKEDCYKEAERLGIDTTGMSWPTLQKVVSNALKLEELEQAKTPVEEWKPPVRKQAKRDDNQINKYFGKTLLLAPELNPERYRLVKYDEVLGDDIEIEERHFDINSADQVFDSSGRPVDYNNVIDQYHDYTTGTYVIKKRGDRKVVAQSSVPKENFGLSQRIGYDLFPVVSWNGRYGYLWDHMRYPNVKHALMESGYFQEYKHMFKDEPNVWYAAGKVLACDPHLVHKVFGEIEEKAKARIEETKAKRRALGLE